MDPLPVKAGAVPSHVSQERATRLLSGAGALGSLRRTLRGPLRRVALLYVPYHVYRVTTVRGDSRHQERYAADAVSGTLDPFHFDSLPAAVLEPAGERNVLPVRLTPQQGAERLRDRLRRLLFQQGFFRAGNLELQIEPTGETVLLPYWAGFFGSGEQARVRVVDGLRGTVEGAKVRAAILQWLNS